MPTTEQRQEGPSIRQRFRAAAKAFGDTRFGQCLNEGKVSLLSTAAIVGINVAAPWGAGAVWTGIMVGTVNLALAAKDLVLSTFYCDTSRAPLPLSLTVVGVGLIMVGHAANAKMNEHAPTIDSSLLSSPPELGQTVSVVNREQNFFSRLGLGLDAKEQQTVTAIGKDAFFVASNDDKKTSFMVFKLNGQNYVATLSAEETFTCSNNTLFVKGTSVSEKGHIIKDKAALLDFSLPSPSPAYPTQITVGGITLQAAQPSACEMAKQSIRTRAKGQVPSP